jgi:iron complex transport system substrate-binding protein
VRCGVLRGVRRGVRLLAGLVVAACAPRDGMGDNERPAVSASVAADAAPVSSALEAPRHDDYGIAIDYDAPARRIVSLNPTTTEVLFALGAGASVAGRSRWDQWPAAASTVPDVGDAIRPSVERVVALRPDLVLLYASGDNRAAAQAMTAAGLRVVALRVDRIADFERCVRTLGALTGRHASATSAIDTMRASLDAVRAAMDREARLHGRPTVFLHVWDNPLLAIGGASYLSELVEVAGGRNIYADIDQPSPQVSFEDLAQRDPAVILAGPAEVTRLAAEPRWRGLRAVREGRVLAYDTTLVSRPSLRLGEAARALARLLHPSALVP